LLKIFQKLQTFNIVHNFSQLSSLQYVEKMSSGLWYMLVRKEM